MIASMTRSQFFKSAYFVVPVRLASVVVLASSVTLPFATPSVRNFSIRPRPFFSTSSLTSRTMVLKPAAADTCAMPAPINPQPNTPTVLIAITPHADRPPKGGLYLFLKGLDDHRDALPAADARRRHAVFLPPAAQFQQQRQQQPRAAGAERMADGDGAAVDVHFLTIETQ